MEKDKIIEKWNKFLGIPFPEIENVELHANLAEIDTFSAGCIATYVDGKLDQECVNILKQSLYELQEYIPRINGESKTYFVLLREIISNILMQK